MIGIISLLTDEAYLEVQRVQRWLEEEYGLPKLAFFRPHITYLIGEGDGDREAVIERARALASGTDLITILIEGNKLDFVRSNCGYCGCLLVRSRLWSTGRPC